MSGAPTTEFWDTTYNDYGRFYKGLKIENSAARCEKKCDALSRELKECQKKLDELRIRTQATEESSPERRSLKHMLRYQSPISNLRPDRPKTYSDDAAQQRRNKEQQQAKNDKAKEDNIQAYRYRLLYPGEYNMEYKELAPPPVPEEDIFKPNVERPGPVHPVVNRYNHYKFYGYGGQGAKTSWGHNYPLGFKIPFCKRTRRLPSICPAWALQADLVEVLDTIMSTSSVCVHLGAERVTRRSDVLLSKFFVSSPRNGTRRKRSNWYNGLVASIEVFAPEDVVVDRPLGSYGYMNISSYTPPQFGGSVGAGIENLVASFESNDMRRIGGQEVDQGSVQTRLYCGRITRGPQTGKRVLLKAYPGRNVAGPEADMMAANELNTHAILQGPSGGELCENIAVLLGGFETQTGEQWLVFRNDGILTGADYATAASVATMKAKAVGDLDFWDRFDSNKPIYRRQSFIRKLLRGAFTGLSFMHSRGRLHQSLGPASVVLNMMGERDESSVVPRLRDLAFSADVSDEAVFQDAIGGNHNGTGVETLSDGLWRRATMAGAQTAFDRKAFGIADDIYAGGLLLAYIVFASLSKPGSIDGPSLQRLLESTFRLDLNAAREYCLMDDRWEEAVKFLDLDDKAGWELAQTMLNPDYRQRPIADAVLCHRFMTG